MRFRHYKGGLYELICEATLESDLTPLIVYRAADGSCWVRPKSVFFELVDVDGRRVLRFAPVQETGETSMPQAPATPPDHGAS
jgi:hypothetical protein